MPELTLHVCANLAREVRAALQGHRLGAVHVRPFAPVCEPRPVAGTGALALGPGEVMVGGACVDELAPGAAPHQRLACQTCFHLLEDGARVDALLAQGAFLVTPGWLSRWRRWMARGGLEGACARELFGESARRVILLDTGVDEGAGEALAAFAAFVGLPAERRPVSLERLGLLLAELCLRRRAERAEQRLADHAMALDTLSSLSPATEPAVAEAIARLAQALCGSQRAVFWPSVPGTPRRIGPPVPVPEGAPAAASPQEEADALAADGSGFVVRIGPEGAESGWLAVAELRFPAHLERYQQAAATLAQAGHLALQNARQLRGLVPICFGCKKIREDGGYWSRVEEYLAAHSHVTFSHGLCPECLERLYPEG